MIIFDSLSTPLRGWKAKFILLIIKIITRVDNLIFNKKGCSYLIKKSYESDCLVRYIWKHQILKISHLPWMRKNIDFWIFEIVREIRKILRSNAGALRLLSAGVWYGIWLTNDMCNLCPAFWTFTVFFLFFVWNNLQYIILKNQILKKVVVFFKFVIYL